MPEFIFTAIDKRGKTQKGLIDAIRLNQAITEIEKLGYYPVKVYPKNTSLWGKLNTPLGKDKITFSDLVSFSREMAELISAKIPIDQALAHMMAAHQKSRIGKAARKILSLLREGLSFSEAMTHIKGINGEYIAMLRAGEEAGVTGRVLGHIAHTYEEKAAFKRELISMSIYPAILAAMLIAAIYLTSVFLLPQFEAFFSNEDQVTHPLTSFVLATGFMVREFSLVFVFSFAVLALAFKWAWEHKDMRYKIEKFLTSAPLVGKVYFFAYYIGFFRSVALMLSNNVDMTHSLKTSLQTIKSPIVKKVCENLYDRVKEGDALSMSLEEAKHLPQELKTFSSIGEQTGELADMLSKAVTLLENKIKAVMKRILILFSPLITLILGGFIALFMAGIMLGLTNLENVALG